MSDYLKKNMPYITPERFFQSVFKDSIMQLEGGLVLAAFKQSLREALHPQASAPRQTTDWAFA